MQCTLDFCCPTSLSEIACAIRTGDFFLEYPFGNSKDDEQTLFTPPWSWNDAGPADLRLSVSLVLVIALSLLRAMIQCY